MHARLLPLLATVAVHAPSAHAAPSPLIDPVMARSGITLSSEVRDVAYCETSKRAALWLASGEVVAIESTGRSTSLGMLPRPAGFGNRVVCDRKDRVIAIDRTNLAVLERGIAGSIAMADAPAQLGLTTDGRVMVLDAGGNVSSLEGTTFQAGWSTRARIPTSIARFSPDGAAIAFVQGGVVTVVDRSGSGTGPRGVAVAWNDDALLIASPSGLVQWRPGDRADALTVIDAKARGNLLFRVGKRVGQLDGPRAIVRDLGTPRTSTELSRWPSGAWLIAAGQSPQFVIAGGRSAYVVDASRTGPVVPLDRPHLYVTSLAFSPDGKQLAITDGDAVLVRDLATRKVQRLAYPPTMFAPKLFWDNAGLRAMFLAERLRWQGGKPIVESLGERGLALDDHGEPVDRQGLCRQGFGYISQRGVIAARCNNKVVFGTVGQPPSFTTPAHSLAFAIAGATPRLVYADNNRIMAASLDGSVRELGTVRGQATSIVPDSTGKRLAIVYGDNEITIWDIESGSSAVTLLTAANPEGPLARVAWSADGKQLAVANGLAVAVWTLGLRG
jgi:WD40 repeat protein